MLENQRNALNSINTMNIAKTMTLLNVPFEMYNDRPLKWVFELIENLTPKSEKKKKKVTPADIVKKQEKEYKTWQPRKSTV